ncbi:MAG: OmpA-like protein, partial [Acidobacteria bacterium]|nr:OmpA-like protein [Acidobacteriota bacterium]
GTTTLTDATVLSIDVSGAQAFVGFGGSLLPGHGGLDTAAINADGTGFFVNGASFKMVLATGAADDPVVANRGDTYLGIEASLSDAQLIGVQGLELWATGTVKLNKATDKLGSALSPRMNWTAATGAANDPDGLLVDLHILSAVELQVTGSAALNVAFSAGVVAYTGTVTLTFATVTVDGGTVRMPDASVLSIEVNDAAVFVGAGGRLLPGHNGLDLAEINANGVGFLASGVDFRMVLARGAAVDKDVNVIATPPLHGGQTEVAIAVDPTDSDHIIVAPIDTNPTDGIFGTPSFDSVWVSTNGGRTFERKQIPLPATVTRAHGDPTVVFSRDGSLALYAHMVDKPGGGLAMVTALSTDGGATWDPLNVRVIGSLAQDEDGDTFADTSDKEFLAVGPDVADLNADRFVLAWHRSNVIYASTSTDGLLWSAPAVVGNRTGGSSTTGPSGHGIDSIPAFGPDGEIYVVWEDVGETGALKLVFDVSYDGGQTWGVGGHDLTVHFPNSDEDEIGDLTLADLDALDAFAEVLKADLTLVASIEGHTDTEASNDYNQGLSQRRADAIYDYLTDPLGHAIDGSRLTRVYFGESQLAFETNDRLDDTVGGTERDENRRVELTLDRLIYTGSANGFNDSAPGARYFIPAQPDRGVLIRLSADVDRSGGAHNGRIYVAFADQGDLDSDPTTGHDDLDIFVIASDDQGATWSALHDSPERVGADQVRVNDDAGAASQFFSWLEVDQSSGRVALSWYDTRNDLASGNDDVQYFAAFSADGGFTWSSNVQVSDGTSNGHAAGAFNLGDYTGLAYEGGVIHMAWADNSNSVGDNPDGALSSTDTYYDRIIFGATYLGIEIELNDARLIGVDGLELWATGTVKLNKATAADGSELTPRMNWTLATTTNDAGNLLVDLDIASAIKLQVHGAAALDVAGVLVAYSGTVDLTLATLTVSDGTTTLTDATVLSIDVSGAQAFVGFGGSLLPGH